MKKRYFAAVAIVAVCSLLVAGACSREKTIKTDEGTITFNKDGGKFEIKTDKGTLSMTEDGLNVQTEEGKAVASFGSKAKLPENLSKDVPVYQPSEVTMSQFVDGGKKVLLGLSTKDDAAKVADFYKKELIDKGWKIGNRMNMGPTTLMQGKKGEQKINVTINKADKATVISLAYSGK